MRAVYSSRLRAAPDARRVGCALGAYWAADAGGCAGCASGDRPPAAPRRCPGYFCVTSCSVARAAANCFCSNCVKPSLSSASGALRESGHFLTDGAKGAGGGLVVALHVVGLAQPVLRIVGQRARRIGAEEVLEAGDRHRVAAGLQRIERLAIDGLLHRGRRVRSGRAAAAVVGAARASAGAAAAAPVLAAPAGPADPVPAPAPPAALMRFSRSAYRSRCCLRSSSLLCSSSSMRPRSSRRLACSLIEPLRQLAPGCRLACSMRATRASRSLSFTCTGSCPGGVLAQPASEQRQQHRGHSQHGGSISAAAALPAPVLPPGRRSRHDDSSPRRPRRVPATAGRSSP